MSPMTEQVGRVVGGRYRLLKPLGSGASAEVYLGDDVRLRRRVAVKILHTALADDEAFLRRFRAEARAAAALSHPSILAVFDWNGDEMPPYIVTEFLAGGSLCGMLDGGHLLTPSQALLVGLQAAQALAHAHQEGFVHRDVKPANLLFGAEGRLRIADFGLARAIAEAGWTEPNGAVVGTAKYASPEQARGEPLDGRSDVYSLALTLVEAVTGSVPFAADTTIGTLMARLDKPLEVSDELGALGPVVAAAGQVRPADRPDAAELARQLLAAASELPRPARLPLVGIGAVGAAAAGGAAAAAASRDDATAVAGLAPDATAAPATAAATATTAAATTAAAATVSGAVPGSGDTTAAMATTASNPVVDAPTSATHVLPADATEVFNRPAGAPSGPHPPPPPPPGRPGPPSRQQWLIRALAVLAAIAVGVAGAWFFLQMRRPSHEVPAALIGAGEAQINDHVGDFGWRIDVRREHREGTEEGTVVETDPAPGSSLREGETLTVVVSRGAPPVDVPDDESLRGLTPEQAEGVLTGPDIELVPEFVEAPHPEVEEGLVIGLAEGTPATLPRGSTVQVLVSNGPPGPTIPDVTGMEYDDARDLLDDLGFDVDRRNESSDRYERGHVTRTEPAVGEQAPEGSTVTVWVAGRGRGGDDDNDEDGGDRDRVVVPDVTGMSLEDATEEIEDAELTVGGVTDVGGGTVRLMLPSQGSEVPAGEPINLVLSPW
jgi:serine/threonine protein kinase/beta-lactam-binding protein with PASTA domain